MAIQESFILHKGNFYCQTDGVAMGSHLVPTLAKPFLCYHENFGYKSLVVHLEHNGIADVIFVFLESEKHVADFLRYLN